MSIAEKISTLEMTHEERVENITKINEAYMRGDMEEYERRSKLIPIDPVIAEITKRYYGLLAIQRMIDSGYNFSLVEDKFGKEWLSNNAI